MDNAPYQKLEGEFREMTLRREEEDRELAAAAEDEKAKLEELKQEKRSELEEKNNTQTDSLVSLERDRMMELKDMHQSERESLEQMQQEALEQFKLKRDARLEANKAECAELEQKLEAEIAAMDRKFKRSVATRKRIQKRRRESEDAVTKESMFKLLLEQSQREVSVTTSGPGNSNTSPRAATQTDGERTGSGAIESDQPQDSEDTTNLKRDRPDSPPQTPPPRPVKKIKIEEYFELLKARAARKAAEEAVQEAASRVKASTPATERAVDSGNDNKLIKPDQDTVSEADTAMSDAETTIERGPHTVDRTRRYQVLRLHCPDIDPQTNALRALSEWRPSADERTMRLHGNDITLWPVANDNTYLDVEHPDWVISVDLIFSMSYNPNNAVVSLLRPALELGVSKWQSRDVWIQFVDANTMQAFVDNCIKQLGREIFYLEPDLEIPSFELGHVAELGDVEEFGDVEELDDEDKENRP